MALCCNWATYIFLISVSIKTGFKCRVREDKSIQPHLTSLSAGGQRPWEEWIVMSPGGHWGFWRFCKTDTVCESQTESDQLNVRGRGASGPIHRGPAKCWQHPPWHPIRFPQGLQATRSHSQFQCHRPQFISDVIYKQNHISRYVYGFIAWQTIQAFVSS